jgi:hypothetical protein
MSEEILSPGADAAGASAHAGDQRGGCLCGAVRFIAEDVPARVGVCHCPMCQRWTGTGLAEVSVPEDKVHWRGLSKIRVYASSDWGERAFCGTCGSGLWFRVTEEGGFSGNYDIPLGLFDDTTPFELAYEIYTDFRPPALRYQGQGQVMLTRAECVEKFPRLAEDGATGSAETN